MMASKDTISQFPLHNPRAAQAQSSIENIGKSVLNSGEVALIGAGPGDLELLTICLLYTSPNPRDTRESRMPASA